VNLVSKNADLSFSNLRQSPPGSRLARDSPKPGKSSAHFDEMTLRPSDFADGDPRSATMLKRIMPVTISDEVLKAAHITEPELKQELALTLFQQERLTLAQASRLAGMGQLAFQNLLAERRIPVHYGVEEFREDLRSLRLTERP
jgi:predicted HTH domain antitoxin